MRIVEKEPTYEELVEQNRQYLLAVLREHPEYTHMVPAEMLREPVVLRKDAPVMTQITEPLPDMPSWVRAKAIEISAMHGITIDQLINGGRSPYYTPARCEFVVACRAMKQSYSYNQIGNFMNRDHAAAIRYERIARGGKWDKKPEAA